AAKFETSFGHSAVDLADVKRRIGLAQNYRRGLRNSEISETDIARLFVLLKLGDFRLDLGLGRAVGPNVVSARLIFGLIVGLIVVLIAGLIVRREQRLPQSEFGLIDDSLDRGQL